MRLVEWSSRVLEATIVAGWLVVVLGVLMLLTAWLGSDVIYRDPPTMERKIPSVEQPFRSEPRWERVA